MILKMSQLQIIGKAGSNGINSLIKEEREFFDDLNDYLQEYFGKTVYEEFGIQMYNQGTGHEK